jgi:hypothetical protein
MKSILVLALFVSSLSSMAASVKITSFNYVRGADTAFSPLAELCGRVTDATSVPTFIQVLVDHKANRPGTYNTLAGTDGKFCLAVITYRGTAEVSIVGEKKVASFEIQ